MGTVEHDELQHDIEESRRNDILESEQIRRDELADQIFNHWKKYPEEAVESLSAVEQKDLLYDLFWAWGKGLTGWATAYEFIMNHNIEMYAEREAEREQIDIEDITVPRDS